MPDRETVMSWLEGLAQDDWRQYHSDSEVQEIARSTLALLEEQEPVKPIRIRGSVVERCGICGTFIYAPPNKFCPNCGRKVKRK